MRFLFKLILLLVFFVPLAIAGALYLAIDVEPAVRRAAEITPANIKRAKRILDENIRRGSPAGTRLSVTINQPDLDLAANYLAHFYANGSARLDLQNDKAQLMASLRPPMVPIFYFNVSAVLTEGAPLPRFEQLRVGRLPIPGFIADWLSMRVVAQLLGEDALDTAAQTIKQLKVTHGHLLVVYEQPANLREKLRSAMVSAGEQARLSVYLERLTLISNAPKVNKVSLTEFLVALFELAAARSRQNDPVAENRAAILVLAFYVNDKPLGTILSAANESPPPMEHRVTLNGRDDFAKHFIISAALAANAGGPLADAVGLYKEIDDSRGGSGFSFNDIAADRAGTRFGEQAAGSATSARKLQEQLAAGIAERDIMPATDDLPEFMAEAEFKRRFGGVDATAYKQMMADIERRIAALKLYR